MQSLCYFFLHSLSSVCVMCTVLLLHALSACLTQHKLQIIYVYPSDNIYECALYEKNHIKIDKSLQIFTFNVDYCGYVFSKKNEAQPTFLE